MSQARFRSDALTAELQDRWIVTRSASDEIVLRDGKLVRSPADWAVAAAEQLAGGSLRALSEPCADDIAARGRLEQR